MSFQDPPGRPRYPALAQYEEEQHPAPGYTDSFDGSSYQPDGQDGAGWVAARASLAPAAGYGDPAGNGYAADGGSYQANGYQDSGYQDSGYQDSGYQDSGYQDNGYPAGGYDANGYPGNGYQGGGYDANGYDANGYPGNGYQGGGYEDNGYSANGYDASGHDANGYQASGAGGYDTNGYDANGYQAGAEFGGAGGGYSTATLQRSADESWRSGGDHDRGGRQRQPDRSGMLAGALTGFLAVAVAIGIATLVAGFARSQASPVIAVGDAFINHVPSALKSHFGQNERKMLFGVMYVIVAVIAVVTGIFARRKVAVGVTAIWVFALVSAFAAIILPGSHPSAVVPSLIGGIAGMLALIFLIRTSYADNTTRAPARRRASAIGAR